MVSILPFELDKVQFPNEKGTVAIAIKYTEKKRVYSISVESAHDIKKWSEKFPDLSSCCDNAKVKIPDQIVLDSLTQALSKLNAENVPVKELQQEVPIALEPKCTFKEGVNALLCLTIPFGASVIKYTFSLSPEKVNEMQLLRLQTRELEDAQKSRNKDMRDLQKNFGELKTEYREMKTEFREFKVKLEAFLFRDAKALKQRGYTVEQLVKAGFSLEEILFAWSRTELRAMGFIPTAKFQYYKGQHFVTLCDLTPDNRTVTALDKDSHRYVTSATYLPRDCVSYFKLTIQTLHGWIGMGLIGTQEPKLLSYSERSSYSWANSRQVWIDGVERRGYQGWVGFLAKDQVLFRYEPFSKVLTMKVKKRTQQSRLIKDDQRMGKGKTFSMKCYALLDAYVHINLYSSGDIVTLDDVSPEEEIEYFGEKSS